MAKPNNPVLIAQIKEMEAQVQRKRAEISARTMIAMGEVPAPAVPAAPSVDITGFGQAVKKPGT